MNAVIKTGGKQYRVSEGSVIFVEKLAGNEGDKVVFEEILMLDEKVGNPYVNKASVEGVILKQGKQKKIRVFKYKSKDRSNRRTLGHRQPYTKILVKKING
ncbi:MAG: 50S ribosomal protein L21 [Firmicutes bacterium]|nr:50S ribosomal protein L21 [Bacillota bacterium]